MKALTLALSHSFTKDAAAPALWERPDPALAAAGIEGEYVVARVRMLAMALLLIAPTWNILHYPSEPMHVTGFSVTLATGLASVAIWWMLRRGRWRPWIGFVSSAFDVSMVSLALASFLVVASPMIALNSKVTFEMYFLAIVATSLRYDARICIVVGLLALAEYGGLWAYAANQFDLRDPVYVAAAGPYSTVDLWTRLILLGIATILSVTLVRRAQRLLYLASRDRLTGLFNRGYFDRALVSAMNAAARTGQPLSLALIDVDHFKKINDVHGHALGDWVLQQVADLLARSMRRTDIVARYGGEEFVILMPGSTREAALARIDELRREISSTPIDLDRGETMHIGFSAGVAETPGDTEATTGRLLVSVADRRLLMAKRTGRGRCIGSDEASTEGALR
ncbi:MAG: GGDEF domain-containing protein [Gemmatimonadota bacterium]